MKKYSIVISLFAMLLTACDPTVEEEGSIAASMTEAQLEQAATLGTVVKRIKLYNELIANVI